MQATIESKQSNAGAVNTSETDRSMEDRMGQKREGLGQEMLVEIAARKGWIWRRDRKITGEASNRI